MHLETGEVEMTEEKSVKNTPYLSGVIYSLDGTPISKVVLWIQKPRKKQACEEAGNKT